MVELTRHFLDKETTIAVNYNKLWKLLIDKNMTNTQLIKAAKISTNAMAKLGKNEDVRVDVLVKICGVLNCTIDDIMELVPNTNSEVDDNG